MLNANDILATLSTATEQTIVHIEYQAGRPANDRGIKEYAEARDWNKPSTSYVGHFVGMKKNKFGELVLTLFVHNRGQAGQFRAFNPNLGTVLSLKVEALS